MNIILLERIANVGNVGENVVVKSGYARNYLIPQGKAIFATEDNLKQFEGRRKELEQLEANKQAQAQEKLEQLKALTSLTIECQANEEGHLYGALNSADVAALILEKGIEIEKKQISFPNGALKVIGEHAVDVHLYDDMNHQLTINISASESKDGA